MDEGSWIRLDPSATSSHLGAQINALVRYRKSSHWEIAAGYARFFDGAYLRETGVSAPANKGFLGVTWTM